ncbi:MAG TPA: PASTA domain-containing protein, partial [Actinomycetes bacterium]|nr:PASTA domain-containing protein [Actinomycetes bacterium]
ARALAEAAWTEPVGAVLGTARYASPEGVQGVPVDGKADVYSLAVVLVEGVTGRVPFAAESTVATLVSRLDRPLEAPPELGPLGPVVARAGRPDPKERLDAVGFAAALQAVARELAAPEPLALAGPATFDMNHLAALEGDPTDLGTMPAPKPPPPAAPVPAVPAVSEPEVTKVTPAFVEPEAAPTAVIATPREPEQAEVTAVLTSKKAGRRRRWPWILLLVLALVGGGGTGTYLLVSDRVPSHPIPGVVGRERADAEGALRAAKFVVVVEEQFMDGTRPGLVADQTPKAGTDADGEPLTLKEGGRITILVSKGPPPTPVPDLTGLTQAKAEAEIGKVGHVVGKVEEPYDETVPEGIVMDWTRKGESPPKGATIDLTVSAGPEPRVVPTLFGLTYDQAVAAIEARGLRAVRGPDKFVDDDANIGKVILAAPSQGVTVPRGTTVTLTVSKGRPEVPNLTGSTVEEARTKLAAQGLTLGTSFGPGGRVFLSRPAAGSKVAPGSSVDVFIL